MAVNGAVPHNSLSNMSFGPPSSSSDTDADVSFIVLDRMTAEDDEKIVNELTASVCAFNIDTNLGVSVASSNHCGENPPSTSSAHGNREFLSNVSDNSLPSEVKQRMNSLVLENDNLRVTVNQTNVSLKQLMTTLEQCREDMDRVRQEHKEKFQETRDLVLKLKKEKAEMRLVIEELQAKVEELQLQATHSLFEAVGVTASEIEFKSKIDDLQSQLSIAEASLQAEREKNSLYLEENTSLKNHTKSLESKIDDLQSQLSIAEASLQAEREKNSLYLEENTSVKNHTKLLESKLVQFEGQKVMLEELDCLREANVRLREDLQNLSSVEKHSREYQVAQANGFIQRVDELTVKLMCTEEQLAKANSEIAQLKSFEIVQHSAEDRTLNEESLINARATVDRLRLRIDEMTAKIVELDQKCENQAQEISNLQNENSKQSEVVGILQAQVEVYRTDFIAERDCREKLAGEKEQLAEDLRRLHRRNLELQEQRTMTPVQGEQTSNSSVEQPEEESQNSSYRCPICQIISFRTLQALNEHLDH
ncbi:NF-kappa-B essential modulator, partial [Frankliniella fusca]